MGSGLNASASQGLTAVSTTTDNATAANIIHNSAANGSTAAQLRRNTTTQSGLSPAEESSSSNGSSHSASVSDAVGRGSADNAVSDSTSVASQSTPDKVCEVTLVVTVMPEVMPTRNVTGFQSVQMLTTFPRLPTLLHLAGKEDSFASLLPCIWSHYTYGGDKELHMALQTDRA